MIFNPFSNSCGVKLKRHGPGSGGIVVKSFDPSHLSKWPSDLKSNGTQENITFSGPVFHGLSCGIFLFVASVSFKNHLLNGLNFSTANQVLLFYGFWS